MNPPSSSPSQDERVLWNQAHDRLRDFFSNFALGDHTQVSRLTLKLLDEARETYRQDAANDPVCLVMARAQKLTGEWLATNLDMQEQPNSKLFASGYIALLLSRTFQDAPETFLTADLPVKLKESIQEKLLVVGPDLKISSMTPRHLDYGPMLDLARRTWHRWNSREILTAVLFWACVYFIFYWWLSETL